MRLEVSQAINAASIFLCLLKKVVCIEDFAAQASGIGNIAIASSGDGGNVLGITLSLGGGIANNGGPITPSTVSLLSEGEATTRPFSVLPTFEPVTATALPIPLITDDSPSAEVPSSLLTSTLETGRVFSTGSSSSGTTCQTCQSISGTTGIPSVFTTAASLGLVGTGNIAGISTTPASMGLVGSGKVAGISTPASMGLVGTGVAFDIVATPASRDVSGAGRASDFATSVSQGRVGTGGALGIYASSSGSPLQATNGSWSFSKSGWTIAPTSVPKSVHTVHSVHTESVTSTMDQENLVSTNTHPAPQTVLNSQNVASEPTRTGNGLTSSVKMSPSSGTGAGVPSAKPSSFTGVASKLREELSFWLMVLLAFISILLALNTH